MAATTLPSLLLLAAAVASGLCIEVDNKLDLWEEEDADAHENDVEPRPPPVALVNVQVVVANGSATTEKHRDVPVYVPVELVTHKPAASRPWKPHGSNTPTSTVSVHDVPVYVPVGNSVSSASSGHKVHYEDVPVVIGNNGNKGNYEDVPVVIGNNGNKGNNGNYEDVPVVIGNNGNKGNYEDVPVVIGNNGNKGNKGNYEDVPVVIGTIDNKVNYDDVPVLIGSSGVKHVKTDGAHKTVPVVIPISINISTGKEDKTPKHEDVPIVIGTASGKPPTAPHTVPPDVPVVYGLKLGPQFHRRGGVGLPRPAPLPPLSDRTFWWPPVVVVAPRPWLPPVQLPHFHPQPPQPPQSQPPPRPAAPSRPTSTTTTASSLVIDGKLDFDDA